MAHAAGVERSPNRETIFAHHVGNLLALAHSPERRMPTMNDAVICSFCGSERPGSARFCSKCGNELATSTRESPEDFGFVCSRCGLKMLQPSLVCSSCGNPVGSADNISGEDGSDEQSVLYDAVAALEELLVPGGSTILVGGSSRRGQRRIEIVTDDSGRFPLDDHAELIELLTELISEECYLRSDVQLEQGPAVCVWHMVGGALFPLKADHAGAVLQFQNGLWPTGGTSDFAVGDAPPIDIDPQ